MQQTSIPMKSTQRWKPLANVPTQRFVGPGFRLAATGADCVAYFEPREGVTFFFEIPGRPTAKYTLSEIKALHRALGTQIAKIESSPLPETRN